MRKHKLTYLVAMITGMGLLLSSCLGFGSRVAMLNKESNRELANSRLEQIIAAIENSDGDAIKSMFSQVALEEAEDIDERIEQLLLVFPTGIDSWKRVVVQTSENNDHGAKDKSISAAYDVYVGEKQYTIGFVDYIIDTENPESVGLYGLHVYDIIDNKPEAYSGGVFVVVE